MIFFLIFIFFQFPSVMAEQNGCAVDGVLSLKEYDFETQKPLILGGEWYFLYNKHTLSVDTVYRDGRKIILNEQNWQDIGYKNSGYGTYAVTILLKKNEESGVKEKSLGIKLRNIFDAYCLYINGKLVAQKGVVASKQQLYHSQMGYETVFFTPLSDTLTIIVQVTNYLSSSTPGIHERPILGSQRQIYRAALFQNYLFIICFGIMILFFIYHLMFYFMRPISKENLFFAIICILFSIKCLCEGDKIIYYIFPQLPSTVYYKSWFLSVDVIYFLAAFYNFQFPSVFPKKVVSITLIVFSVFTLLVLVFPIQYGFVLSKVIYLYSLPLILFTLGCAVFSVLRKLPYAWPNLLGLFVPSVFGINDLLYALNIIHTGYYSAFGFVIYLATQSAILSYKAAKAFQNVEKLTCELEKTNTTLEQMVQERTWELHQANKQLMHTNATKDRFFTILAHDLRSPISTIRSLLELIVIRHESYTKDKITQMVNVLSESSRSTYDLLDNLLNWAKSQRKEVRFTPNYHNLYELVHENVDLFQTTVFQKNITLNNEVSQDVMLYCDKNVFTTVVRNLINNAIKFTPKGGLIRIVAYQQHEFIEIHIIDSGVGMPQATIDALLSNDVVLPSNRGTSGEKGSGLGLVLCKDFIALHNGKLQIESEVSKGSTFKIIIPQNNINYLTN